MDTILTSSLRGEGFGPFDDQMPMKDKDIRDLTESYGQHTIGNGRVTFGLWRIWYLIGLIQWVQDFARVGQEPTIDGMNNVLQFCEALDKAFYRADVCKTEKDQADTVSKVADPGKLKDERKWPE